MRSILQTLLAAACIAVFSHSALAQQAPTTVQLPTFRFFTVQTSVSVPDSGGAYLGGIKRARDGRMTRGIGPLRNGAIGMERGAAGMHVKATIIDNQELDAAVLAEAAARRGGFDPSIAKASALTRNVGQAAGGGTAHSTEPPIESVAAIRARNAAAAAERQSEAEQYFVKAEQAEADGKPAVARIYYQMVARRNAGDLSALANSRLAALGSESASVAKR